jgi:hypothetical protein
VDRRAFLGVLGLTVIGACSSSSGGVELVLVPNDWDFIAGRPYRLSILLANNKAGGAPLALDGPVSIRVGPHGGALGPPMRMQIHAAGPEPNYANATYTFPSPGSYTLQATYKGRTATTPVDVIRPGDSATPVPGDRMRPVATPTVSDHLGVNPYCTQNPPCPFHAVSLDAALAQHQPVALLFATPALCQSRFCGPVLSNLQAVAKGWSNRVTFVHSEIYTDLTGNTPTKAVQVWGLQHEPMLYLGDAGGVIVARVDNLFDRAEATSALTAAYGPPAS